MENTQNKFVDGLFVDRREKAPDYIIASLSFNERFIDWLKEHFNARGYCNVDIKLSQNGKLYAQLNDWKPEERLIRTEQGTIDVEDRLEEMTNREIDTSSIPF